MKIEIDDETIRIARILFYQHDNPNLDDDTIDIDHLLPPVDAVLEKRIAEFLSFALFTMNENDDFYNAFDDFIRESEGKDEDDDEDEDDEG